MRAAEVNVNNVGLRQVCNVTGRNADNLQVQVCGWEDVSCFILIFFKNYFLVLKCANTLSLLSGNEGAVVVFRNLYPKVPTRRSNRSQLDYRLIFSTDSLWEFRRGGGGIGFPNGGNVQQHGGGGGGGGSGGSGSGGGGGGNGQPMLQNSGNSRGQG